ncbi:MAG: hypothetical protein ACRD5Z_03550 [Bryobacteraceae bacterium]
MAVVTLEQAYPDLAFRWRSRNWWARLTRVPPECVHLERDFSWMATFIPDTLFLQGRASAVRQPVRPEVSVCRECLVTELQRELPRYQGRLLAFEPDPDAFSQYFFISGNDFSASGLKPEIAEAIQHRLEQRLGACQGCDQQAIWLWIPRVQVETLDDAAAIATVKGQALCPAHGTQQLIEAFGAIKEANLFYVNVPYGEAGAYLWI